VGKFYKEFSVFGKNQVFGQYEFFSGSWKAVSSYRSIGYVICLIFSEYHTFNT